MKLRSRLSLALCAALLVLAVAVTAGFASSHQTALHDDDASSVTVEPADALAPADECGASPQAADVAADAADGDQAYECKNQQYCQRDNQCDAYCGGSGGACTFGCCRCAS